MAKQKSVKKKMRSFSMWDADYHALESLGAAAGLSTSAALAELIPSPAMIEFLHFLRETKVLGEHGYGDILEELVTLGMLAEPRLGKLADLCVKWLSDKAANDSHQDGRKPATVLPMKNMLIGLRSDDPNTRFKSGVLLAQSIGAGMALTGRHRAGVEGELGKDISALIGLAMSGEATAVDELEKLVLSDQGHTKRTKGKGNHATTRPSARLPLPED